MSKRSSIGSWAFTIGPYASNPIDFDTVINKLKALGFDGVELGAFPPHPNPGNPNGPDDNWPGAMPHQAQRAELKAKMTAKGLAFSGMAANLWGEKLINTADPSKYIAEFRKNSDFARDVFPAMLKEGCRLYGYRLSASERFWWIDRPEDLARVQTEWEVSA